MSEYDVVVIGGGPGGNAAAEEAAKQGLRTAVVEKRNVLGGTCLNVGCIPSKTLLQASELYYQMKNEGKNFGINCPDIQYDLQKLMQKKTEIINGLAKGVESIFKQNKIDWIQGAAQFKDPNTIQMNGKTITAKNFILATGSEPTSLPFAPFDEKVVISSTGALSLSEVPKEMVVIGAGIIGVELASVYNRFGSKVTIVEMLDRITPTIDDTIGKALMQSLKKQGLTFHLGAKVTEIKIKDQKALVAVQTGEDKLSLPADVVLVSVGRRPYTTDLGLENIGIEKTQQGFIKVNNNFQTNKAHIYAIGDIIDGPMLAHKASDEGTAAAKIIAGLKTKVNYATIPSVVYTYPEVASVGLTESEAKEMNLSIKIGTSYFRGNARARCMGANDGLVKVVAEEKTRRLIGLHILGPWASEMIGEGVIGIQKKMTVDELAHICHAHPTLAETIKEAANNLREF